MSASGGSHPRGPPANEPSGKCLGYRKIQIKDRTRLSFELAAISASNRGNEDFVENLAGVGHLVGLRTYQLFRIPFGSNPNRLPVDEKSPEHRDFRKRVEGSG